MRYGKIGMKPSASKIRADRSKADHCNTTYHKNGDQPLPVYASDPVVVMPALCVSQRGYKRLKYNAHTADRKEQNLYSAGVSSCRARICHERDDEHRQSGYREVGYLLCQSVERV